MVPESMKLRGFTFLIGPAESEKKIQYGTEYIRIEEIPWRQGDKEQQFRGLWEEFRESSKRKQTVMYGDTFRNKRGQLRYAENLNAKDVFGFQSVTVAYYDSILSVIAMPEGLLKLTEKRGPGNMPSCTDIEVPAAQLLKHYRWGKRPSSAPDTFYTAMGMFEGYPSEYEDANIFFKHPDGFWLRILTEYTLRSWSIPGADKLPSEDEVKNMARRLGISYQQYVKRERKFVGQNTIEQIYRARKKNDDDYTLFFSLISTGPRILPLTPTRPRIEITLECSWEQREQAMEIWNTVLQNFRLAAESKR